MITNSRYNELDKPFAGINSLAAKEENNSNIAQIIQAQDKRNEILYSLAALEDELVRVISSHNAFHFEKDENDDGFSIRIKWDYLDQAETLIYRINVYDPLPEFVIFTSDLPKWLMEEIDRHGKIVMKKIITNAVRRIYESVDPEYFHTNGIFGKVRWRFVS